MTNFEKYKDEIIENTAGGMYPGVKDGKPAECDKIKCEDCKLDNAEKNCVTMFIKRLYEDDGEETDGCDGCKYEYKREDESPCTECSMNYMSKWERRPKKTRQDEFLEHYPNAEMCNGVIDICPKYVDRNHDGCRIYAKRLCIECHKEYWLQEVKE